MGEIPDGPVSKLPEDHKWNRAEATFKGPTDSGSSPSSSLMEIHNSPWS